MIKRILYYKKYKELYNFKSWEVIAALGLSVLMTFFVFLIDFYNDFIVNVSIVTNILLYIIAGFLGFLGISITCVAIIVSLFDYRKSKKVDEISEKRNTIENFLSSYEFLALLIGIEMIILVFSILLINSSLELVNIFLFYFATFLITYSIVFILFYTIALISLLIGLYNISKKNDEIDSIKKTIFEEANEVRIEFIMSYIANINSQQYEKFAEDLIDFIESHSSSEEAKRYLLKIHSDKLD